MRDYLEEPLQALSMGLGVQSSAMILMMKEGTLEKPDFIVFSDTGSEKTETYDHLPRVEQVAHEIGVPFVTVRSHRGSLHEDYRSKSAIPIVTNRSCTFNFKILPIRRWARTIVGNRNGKLLFVSWLGITTDEKHRAVDPGTPYWAGVRFPLVEQDISRRQCVDILKRHGWGDVVKSGCFLCPFNSMKGWANLSKTHPEQFAIAVEMEEAMHSLRPHVRGWLKNGQPLTYVTPKTTLADFMGGTLYEDGHQERESTCEGFGGCFI